VENTVIIATLDELIKTSRDGELGFRACAEGVDRPDLRSMFDTAARRCAEAASELEAKVRQLGGEPANSGSVAGAAHRGWVNVKSAITGKDETAVLAECERGEDVAKRAYEAALAMDLPPDVKSMVERQYRGTKQNHDRVRDLRDEAARRRKAEGKGSGIAEKTAEMAETGLEYARTIRERAVSGDLTGDVYDQGRRAARTVTAQVERQPFLALALAFGIGYWAAYLMHGSSGRSDGSDDFRST
jgi:uncharacterized protein (TIGR02284 family)